ncbi:MFS transporter [Streptomyces sp. NPDC018693]|uniref:MFS transporter n=1 Tax=unclassified Streptomyces TaxID=2593676 RepID=UPI00379C443D
MSLEARAGSGTETLPAPHPSRHPAVALMVIAAAELMVVLDATIVNIALPSIQTGLDISGGGLAWVVNAYALAFGGLMLLGGRAGDLFGRRRVFRFGITLFVCASLLGGLAPVAGLLIGARALQGVGAAIAAPTALSLIATTFAEGRHRNRAMATYAAMAGVGSTVGLLLGGLLTQYVGWRWVLLVNIPIGLGVLAGTVVLGEADRAHGKADIAGAATGTAGLLALVYAITRGGQDGWTDAWTVTSFGTAAVLLAVFPLTQVRGTHPLLPPRILRDRSRAGTYVTLFLVGTGMFATFYFLTLYMQHVLGYGAIRTGLAYLPFSTGIGIMAAVGSRLVVRHPPRELAAPGLAVAAAGMIWLSRLTPHSSYWGTLMPGMLVTALGLGATFVPLTLGAVRGVDDRDSGSASALLNTAQQTGGALGLATLATLSTAVADRRVPHADAAYYTGLRDRDHVLATQAQAAMTHGYTRAFLGSAAAFTAALLIASLTINTGPQDRTVPDSPQGLS